MFEHGLDLFVRFIGVALFLIYAVFTISLLRKNKRELFEIITNHYQEKELGVTHVLKLNIREKMRYGVPIIPFLSFVSYSSVYFSRSNNDIDYVRKVELVDEEGNEFTKYVDILVENKKVVSFKEFDSYDF